MPALAVRFLTFVYAIKNTPVLSSLPYPPPPPPLPPNAAAIQLSVFGFSNSKSLVRMMPSMRRILQHVNVFELKSFNCTGFNAK